ncbi:YSC84-related protein [Stenotrophomonas rhizophila]|uniref:lipid-binding SYLF domain-containing protein n=1 Tax=Stenotrophomonas rhizophila TaxID=216778 RepID=UPI00112F3755|nr:YSC84-related protein [Stenotrophomonas rhizophila]
MKGTHITALAAAFVLGVGCTSAPPRNADGSATVATQEARNKARAATAEVLSRLYAAQPSARQAIASSAGYAVFRSFGVKVLVAGGGSGHGVAIETASGRETFMRMVEIQAGLGFGAKTFDLVWVFKTPAAYANFTTHGFEVGGQATLAAKVDQAGGGLTGAVQVSDGVWVYQMTESGLAAELTVKGTRYYPDTSLD